MYDSPHSMAKNLMRMRDLDSAMLLRCRMLSHHRRNTGTLHTMMAGHATNMCLEFRVQCRVLGFGLES